MQHSEESRQDQSPLRDAQYSIDAAQNAVHQAASHPTPTMMSQAENALKTADNAMDMASTNENQKAVQESEQLLQQIKEDFSQI